MVPHGRLCSKVWMKKIQGIYKLDLQSQIHLQGVKASSQVYQQQEQLLQSLLAAVLEKLVQNFMR